MSMYLGPAVPRWEPTSEQDLKTAIEQGVIFENHYVELKAGLGDTREANLELARDIAQFTIDSGVIIFGIKENSDQIPTLKPVTLNGFAERVEQVARTIPDPPIPITFKTITGDADTSKGYVIVQVPSTGQAPHMVEGIYYGRGDKTKIRLSNPEVIKLHDQRRIKHEDVRSRLQDAVYRDPISEGTGKQAHVFLVATPNSHLSEMAIDFVRGAGAEQKVRRLVQNATALSMAIGGPNDLGPLSMLSSVRARSEGVAFVSTEFGSGRTVDDQKSGFEYATELEVSDDGELRIYSALFSQPLQFPQSSGPNTYQIIDVYAPILTRQILAMASEVAHETGFAGDWGFGFGATRIAGLTALQPLGSYDFEERYDVKKSSYGMTTVASLEEIRQTPGQITHRLIGRLMRALGREARYEGTYFQDLPISNGSSPMRSSQD